MRNFKVMIQVQSYFTYDIQADSEKEAIQIANELFPDNGKYQIDYDFNNTRKPKIIFAEKE